MFTVLSLAGARSWLANSIPSGLKSAFAVGIGLLLCFVGLNFAGVVILGTPDAPVTLGDISSTTLLLSIGGLFLMIVLLALFLTPVLTIVPACAYGPVLIVVGMLMLEPITGLKFDDMTELAPAFLTIVLMSFTYNLGIGITAGLLTWPLFKIAAGKRKEVPAGLWVLSVLSLVYYMYGA